MMIKKYNKKLLLIVITLLSLLLLNFLCAKADDIIPPLPNGAQGPSVQGNFNINTSKIKPNQLYNKYDNVQVITDGSPNGGAQSMWWHNKVNVMQPFTIKFYAYLAPSNQSADNNIMADGITFTLQNDGKGNKALGGQGNDLGVYGDYASKQNTNRYSSTSINNAFSYEFDPYFNGDPGIINGNSSDYGLVDANGYPINKSTPYGDGGEHTAFTTTNNGIRQDSRGLISQIHYDAQPLTAWNSNNLDPGSFFQKFAQMWHKVIYKWVPNSDGTGTASVNFDDSSITQSNTIDIQNILNANNDNPYVWWGFTGSTGADTMISAIADTKVTGDPGLTKLVLNLSKLSDDQKQQIKDNINNSNESDKDSLLNSINHPSDSSSDPKLSNQLVKFIPKEYFKAAIGDSDDSPKADIGDVLLYKVDIYNYAVNGLGNSWNNVSVSDDNLQNIGMKSLDNQNSIDAYYDSIPYSNIDSNDSQPSSVGLRTIITSKSGLDDSNSARSNTVTAKGGNFLQNDNKQVGIQPNDGSNVDRSSKADVYVNPNSNAHPRIIMDNKIKNISKPNKNDKDNTLNQVESNNEINYNISLKNIVANSNTSNHSTYSFWVPSLSKINSIKINGQNLSEGDNGYTVENGYSNTEKTYDKMGTSLNANLNGNGKKLITIHKIPSISYRNDVNIDANITLGDDNPLSFSSYPVFRNGEPTDNNYYIGQEEKYNFAVGLLTLQPENIDYGLSAGYLSNGFISPYMIEDKKDASKNYAIYDKKSYNVAQITDNRPKKTPYSLYLSQNNGNKNGFNIIGSEDSPFILSYFDNGIYHNIKNDPYLIYTNNDVKDKTSDVYWTKNHELRLGSNNQFRGNKAPKGSYNANLNWMIKGNAP